MSSELWLIMGVGGILLLLLCQYGYKRAISRLAISQDDDDVDNPLDQRVEIKLGESQLIDEEVIQLRVPGEGKLVALKLNPGMRNKVVRLRGVAKNGAADLFVRLQVEENSSYSPAAGGMQARNTPEESDQTQEMAQLLSRLSAMALGDQEKIDRLIEAERIKAPQAERADWVRTAIRRWERDMH